MDAEHRISTLQHRQHSQGRAFMRALSIEVAILSVAAATYVIVRELTEGNPEVAIQNSYTLLHLEQQMGIDHERTLVGLSLEHPAVRTFANWIYIWGHWPVIIVSAAWLYVHHRSRYRWLRNAVITSGLIGFAFFALLPMAPPRLTGMGYVDTITTYSSSYRVMQPPDLANLYAAMPSLHFGWDLLVGIALFTSTRALPVRVFACVMPMLMGFAVIATANHWVLDVVIGLVVISIGILVANRLAQRERERTPAHRSTADEHRPIGTVATSSRFDSSGP